MIKTKKELVIIGLIIVMIITLIGVSYAAFNYSKTGTKLNSITTGSITMTYTETDNVININGALPTTDETGKVRLKEGEYFDFTVSSEIVGDVNINYEISAKDITSSDANKIDGSNIKLYLTKLTDGGTEEELMTPETYNEEASSNSYTGRPSGEMSLYTSSMNSSESNNYRLRMWVDEDYNPQDDGGNLEFSVQINVYGLDGLSMEDRMMRTAGSADFHSSEYKSKVINIVTKGDTVIPAGVVESWDISEKQNGSVIAYVEDDGTGAGTYKVTIGAQDKIIANYDMSSYFSFFTNLTSIDLTYLDTSLTTDMSSLFRASTSLTELDLSNFDTSNVTRMSNMFAFNLLTGTRMALQEIIFGDNFDTSNVTTMVLMFGGCSNLIKLDLSSFDTSNVTNMGQMFTHCSSLTELDLSNFDISRVSNMSQMFGGCSNLIKLDLSSFDTSNVTNMYQMFANCYALTELDLTSFDTTSVTNYSSMFNNANASNLSLILVTTGKWTIPNTVITNAIATDFTYV